MLRYLFDGSSGESRQPSADRQYREAIRLMEKYAEANLAAASHSGRGEQLLRLAVWTQSLLATLYELEQSVYCSGRFAEQVKDVYIEKMNKQEYDDYRRHLYFFENSFIRVFSTLDKLGAFLNELYSLRTEQLKARFSYYTVLRRMREHKVQFGLQKELNAIKEKYKEPMQDLRLMRNHEIHGMNADLLDTYGRIRKQPNEQQEEIENLRENNRKLREGFQMVCESLQTVFMHCNRNIKQKKT